MGARQSRYKKLEEVHELEPKVNRWLRQQQQQQQQQPKGVQGSEDKEYKPK